MPPKIDPNEVKFSKCPSLDFSKPLFQSKSRSLEESPVPPVHWLPSWVLLVW